MARKGHLLLFEDGGLEIERRHSGAEDGRRRDLRGHGAAAPRGGGEGAWGLRGGEGDGGGGGAWGSRGGGV